MMRIARLLREIGIRCGCAILVTNSTVGSVSKGTVKPALGLTWSYVPSNRISLEKLTLGQPSSGLDSVIYKAFSLKSPRKVERQTMDGESFYITAAGVT
mmetsp:Transcript_8488/g.10192  ORF Transcript_8488/g.10192 Transcript_8488/m.10192 type:complete len:99 (+) Transcript_8488:656-952(+)